MNLIARFCKAVCMKCESPHSSVQHSTVGESVWRSAALHTAATHPNSRHKFKMFFMTLSHTNHQQFCQFLSTYSRLLHYFALPPFDNTQQCNESTLSGPLDSITVLESVWSLRMIHLDAHKSTEESQMACFDFWTILIAQHMHPHFALYNDMSCVQSESISSAKPFVECIAMLHSVHCHALPWHHHGAIISW